MKRYYKMREFAERIGVDRHTVSKWRKKGLLEPNIDADGRRYYSEEQAQKYDTVRFGEFIYKGDNWIDLSKIQKERTSDRFDWQLAAEEKKEVPFFYNGRSDTLTIIACKNNKLTVLYDGKTEYISTTSLTSVGLDKLTGAFTKEYKYDVGRHIQLGKTDITILDQIRMGSRNVRGYKYVCNTCHQTNEISEYNIADKGCCPVCSGSIVVPGINDIATTDSWMVPFFQDKALTQLRSHGAGDELYFICPDCGRTRSKRMAISTLYSTRSIACVCGDGYSYPNKFMYSVLEQLLLQKRIKGFDKEYIDDWTDGKRYDFLVTLFDEREKPLIIEMDGGLGHGNRTMDKTILPEDTVAVDQWKDEQALMHGYQIKRIDALLSEKEYLEKSIRSSLSDLIDFQYVDWSYAEQFAYSNLVKDVCIYYESHKPITTKQLGDIFHISQSTALKYLLLFRVSQI